MGRIVPGQRFGKWTAVETVRLRYPSGIACTKWKCVCECGKKSLVASSDLNSGKSTKCRKCYGNFPIDLSGKTFSQWSVVSCKVSKHKKTHCLCNCSCGNLVEVAAASLLNGVSTRCKSCYNKYRDAANHTGKPLYSIWATMIARCENKKHISYKNYGARGITVCKEWHNLDVFSRDIGPRPSKKYSLDRIDNDKGYFPDNCKWSTGSEQGNNRRSNHIINYNNKEMTISAWALFLSVKVDTLCKFLTRNTFEVAYKHYTKK